VTAETPGAPRDPATNDAPVLPDVPVALADGLLVIDKPGGLTSHDVVARARRALGTRKVGHAGTLDPMATGVLVLGVGRATRLLGHLTLSDKTYTATIRLGVATNTDDAEGEVIARRPVAVEATELARAMAALTGDIDQVPAAVSAIKVGGVRSYTRARAGETVTLPARPVHVATFELLARRDGLAAAPGPAGPAGPVGPVTDLDVVVACSSGTYIRALARDLGEALGCGGHLTALRRERVGPFGLAAAIGLDELATRGRTALTPLADAVAALFPRRDVDAPLATALRHGRAIPEAGMTGPYGVFDADGTVLALATERAGLTRPLVVFAPA
jgi:tRNA pseudouridine55 synthase